MWGAHLSATEQLPETVLTKRLLTKAFEKGCSFEKIKALKDIFDAMMFHSTNDIIPIKIVEN